MSLCLAEMAGPSSGAAPPKESAEGKSAGGAPKLMRAMRFLPKTAEGREAAKKRIKSKKQVGGAADGEDGAEDKEKDKGAHEQKDSWKAKMAKAVRRKKPKKPKTGEMTVQDGAARAVLSRHSIALRIVGRSF